jgi:predicted dehydrogenase
MTPLKWGLIGAGDIVRKRVAAALRDSSASTLVAIARGRSDLAASFAGEVGAARSYADWRSLIAAPDIDAVYVATPVHLHAEQTIAAAEAGKHVLCEKPMALDVDECDHMLAACRAHRVHLGVAYYRHFYPVIQRMKGLLDADEIGDPVYAQINAFEWFDLPPDHPRAWFLKREQAGGGPMFDFGCHRLEVLTHLFGSVRRVSGMLANVLFSRDVEDTAVALLQFERGTCATVTVTHAVAEPRDTLEIFGSRGSLHVGQLNKGDLRIRQGGAERVEAHPPAANLHLPLVEDFIDAVVHRRDPGVPGETGREIARLEQAIYATEVRT